MNNSGRLKDEFRLTVVALRVFMVPVLTRLLSAFWLDPTGEDRAQGLPILHVPDNFSRPSAYPRSADDISRTSRRAGYEQTLEFSATMEVRSSDVPPMPLPLAYMQSFVISVKVYASSLPDTI